MINKNYLRFFINKPAPSSSYSSQYSFFPTESVVAMYGAYNSANQMGNNLIILLLIIVVLNNYNNVYKP